jgi:hypothetical protein
MQLGQRKLCFLHLNTLKLTLSQSSLLDCASHKCHLQFWFKGSKEVPKYLFYTYSDLAPLQSSDFTAFPNWSVIPTTAVTPFLLLFHVHEKFKLLSSVNNFKFNGIFNMFLDERFCSTVNKRSQKWPFATVSSKTYSVSLGAMVRRYSDTGILHIRNIIGICFKGFHELLLNIVPHLWIVL